MPSFTVPSPNALMVRPERSLLAKDSAMSSLFSTPGPIMLNSCSLVSRYWVKVVGGGDICGEGVIVGGLAIRLVEVRKHDRSSWFQCWSIRSVGGVCAGYDSLPRSGSPPAVAHGAIEHLSGPTISLRKVHLRYSRTELALFIIVSVKFEGVPWRRFFPRMNASMIARSFFSGVLGNHHVSDDAVIWFWYIFSQMKVILELRGL